MRLLNVGCGGTFHPEWTNIDVISTSPHVMAHDLRKGIPFPDGTFDAVYNSHVLEHFERSEGTEFLRENLRVLKAGGTMRVVLPDFEEMARTYLATLERAAKGEAGAEHDHEWMLLEILDQTVRSKSGGLMGEYLRSSAIPNLEFVRWRIGMEAEVILNPPHSQKRTLRQKTASKSPAALAGIIKRKFTKAMVRAVGGSEAARHFGQGAFRSSGEIHQWMYDEVLLRRVLSGLGLKDIKRRDEHHSSIPDFARYSLEAVDGKVRKPHSLILEATK